MEQNLYPIKRGVTKSVCRKNWVWFWSLSQHCFKSSWTIFFSLFALVKRQSTEQEKNIAENLDYNEQSCSCKTARKNEHVHLLRMIILVFYEYEYYVNCGHTYEMKMWSSQLWLRFKQSQSKPEKCFRGFNGIRTHGLCVSAAVLHQLSYEDPYVGSRPICGIHRTRERNETYVNCLHTNEIYGSS